LNIRQSDENTYVRIESCENLGKAKIGRTKKDRMKISRR